MTLEFRTKTDSGPLVRSVLEAFTFPGGEAHVKGSEIEVEEVDYQLAILKGADSHELFQLAMWKNVCDHRREKAVLILPYLPGARADKGSPLGGGVYAEFIGGLHLAQTITLDPHSPLMPNRLDFGPGYLSVYPVERIIKRELGDRGDHYNHPYVGVIAPDKGAVDRAQKAANVLHVPLFKAEKTRDFESGQLTGFTCEELPATGKLLLVDDICDGGGTFVGLAKATGLPYTRLDLWVTHGIFSKGIDVLTDSFDHIYTTDSWGTKLHSTSYLTIIPVLPYLTGEINV